MGVRNLEICALVVLALSALATAQVTLPRGCPNVKIMKNFDVTQYMGTWYEYQKYPASFETGSCIKAVYAQQGSTVTVKNTQTVAGATNTISGTATIDSPGQLTVQFNNVPSVADGSNYLVLGTDYTNYAVVFSCKSIFNLLHTEYAWILTRDREPSTAVIQTAYNVLKKNKISKKHLTTTIQSNCPASNAPYPTATPHTPAPPPTAAPAPNAGQ